MGRILQRLPFTVTGQLDINVLTLIAVCLIYAGTGGWSDERWREILGTIMGCLVGYNTYNPSLRSPEQGRDERGRFTGGGEGASRG